MNNKYQTTDRKLTMEEKRRLEKMIFADIEEAEHAYNNKRNSQRDLLGNKLVKNAPASVKKLFAEYVAAEKKMKQADKALEALGYDISSNYGTDTRILKIAYHKAPAELKAFDAQTMAGRERLTSLKRTYAVKLFGGGAEATKLFADLAKEIQKLTA